MSDPAPNADGSHGPPSRPSGEMLFGRALRLRCPRCGEGKLFSGWLKMPERCLRCGFRFEPEPGFYLGSMYVNYGLTALITTMVFVVGRFRLGIPGSKLLWPLAVFCVIFPMLLFRHSRALWLALDCLFDKNTLERDPDTRRS